MRVLKTLCLAVGLSLATGVLADERPDHFSGEPAPDLKTALTNLATYNDKLRAILEKDELLADDYARIHELSYTLENALQRIHKELDGVAESLESVHLASEHMDKETIRESVPGYLSTSEILTGGAD